MRLLPVYSLITFLAVCFGAGCASVQKIKAEPLAKGEALQVEGDADRVTPKVRAALEKAGYDVIEESTVDGGTAIYGEVGMGMQSFGQYLRALVIPEGQGKTKVVLHNVRKVDSNPHENLKETRKEVIKEIKAATDSSGS